MSIDLIERLLIESGARPIAIAPTARIVETRGARYEVLQAVDYALDNDVLTLDVDGVWPYDRQYRIEWRGAAGELAVVGHCAPGSLDALETSELPANEAYDLLRFVECSDDVASIRARLLDDAIAEAVKYVDGD